MAAASISVDQDQFSCPVCLDLLKDPVTTPCGHNFCKVCINRFWDLEARRRFFICPQCREKFTPRPVLRKNNMLAEMVEKLKTTKLRAASSADAYAGPGDVECDSCVGRKRKALHSCLVCLASYCVDHLQPHYQSQAFKKHKLVEACADFQKKICSDHDKVIEIFCRTDRSFICYLCMMDKHKHHDTVSTQVERAEKQNELNGQQMKSRQLIEEKQKKLQELQQAVDNIKMQSQEAVDDGTIFFAELISYMEKKRSEMTEVIKAQEKAALSRAEQQRKQTEQEIADLRRIVTEMEQLSNTDDHILFLQKFPSLCHDVAGHNDSSGIAVDQHLSFDGLKKSLSDLKRRIKKMCVKELSKIVPQAADAETISPSGPKSREDFLQHFFPLTLDPNTAYYKLILSEENRAVTCSGTEQRYSAHPERFDYWVQVLCTERMCGRCYWEVEWSGMVVSISVSYKDISRKGQGNECMFGRNSQSWSLQCSSSSASFWHNDVETELQSSVSSRVGVFVDHKAGTLSFYNVSDTMSLIHGVHTTFTQPLYAGFFIFYNSTLKLCDSK